MTVCQEVYEQYIKGLHEHLFDGMPIEQIMGNWQNSHRKRRFIVMYLLQSKDIFHFYYGKRKEHRIEPIFNQVISALLYEPQKSQLKLDFVSTLGITKDMITENISSFQIKEMMKYLHSFQLCFKKRYDK